MKINNIIPTYNVTNYIQRNEKKTPCKICGTPTVMIGTRLCDNCWELEKSMSNLIKTDKTKAEKWIKKQLKKIK
jgi:hypothetical protein